MHTYGACVILDYKHNHGIMYINLSFLGFINERLPTWTNYPSKIFMFIDPQGDNELKKAIGKQLQYLSLDDNITIKEVFVFLIMKIFEKYF